MRYLQLLLLLIMTASCNSIDEAERLIYVEPATVSRAVLIEDFTGQRCVNCPRATDEIHRLQEAYGEDNVIAVSIHAGPLAVYSTARVAGLRTELGDAYYDYWHVEVEPSGMVNRKGGVLLLDHWATQVYQELQERSAVDLSVSSEISGDELKIAIRYRALDQVKGKLQVWLTESGIVAPQMMPDGTMATDYIHNHVLRAAVNGVWGEDIDWQQGESSEIHYTIHLDDGWNPANQSVVAFAYDSSGVLQVTEDC